MSSLVRDVNVHLDTVANPGHAGHSSSQYLPTVKDVIFTSVIINDNYVYSLEYYTCGEDALLIKEDRKNGEGISHFL